MGLPLSGYRYGQRCIRLLFAAFTSSSLQIRTNIILELCPFLPKWSKIVIGFKKSLWLVVLTFCEGFKL